MERESYYKFLSGFMVVIIVAFILLVSLSILNNLFQDPMVNVANPGI